MQFRNLKSILAVKGVGFGFRWERRPKAEHPQRERSERDERPKGERAKPKEGNKERKANPNPGDKERKANNSTAFNFLLMHRSKKKIKSSTFKTYNYNSSRIMLSYEVTSRRA